MAERCEPSLTDLVHNLPLLDDLFDNAALDETEPGALMASQPSIIKSTSGDRERPLADLVRYIPTFDDLFEEESALEEMDCSVSTPSRQDLHRVGMEDQIEAEGCERPPADLVNDLSMLDELFEGDAVPEEADHSTRISAEPIPCSTGRWEDSSGWHDEAYYSYSSVLDDTSWLAADVSTFVSSQPLIMTSDVECLTRSRALATADGL